MLLVLGLLADSLRVLVLGILRLLLDLVWIDDWRRNLIVLLIVVQLISLLLGILAKVVVFQLGLVSLLSLEILLSLRTRALGLLRSLWP